MNYLLKAIERVEECNSIESQEFLTDAEELHPDVEYVLECAEDMSRNEIAAALRGRYEVIYGDCICVRTKKGIINLGLDSF